MPKRKGGERKGGRGRGVKWAAWSQQKFFLSRHNIIEFCLTSSLTHGDEDPLPIPFSVEMSAWKKADIKYIKRKLFSPPSPGQKTFFWCVWYVVLPIFTKSC